MRIQVAPRDTRGTPLQTGQSSAMRKQPRFGVPVKSIGIAGLIFFALACNLLAQPSPTATHPPTASSTPVPPTPTAGTSPITTATLPYPDVSSVFGGLCYNFLKTLRGQTLVFDSMADLSAFYNQVDKSKQCPDAAIRQPFDFTDSQIIGTVVTGKGCRLDLNYEQTETDNAARQRIILFREASVGDCDYELVRPVWLAIERPAPGYTTLIRVTSAS